MFISPLREDLVWAALGEGPLAGLSLAIKDNFDLNGKPTFAGGRNALVEIAPATARAVQQLLDAGITLKGRAHMSELAIGGWGTNAALGTPFNPRFDAPHVPGGSSSGCAAAIASGLVDIALGTDTGGSVRIPASFCGLYGFKPVQAAISLHGVRPLAPSLDTVGILANTLNQLIRAADAYGIETQTDASLRLMAPDMAAFPMDGPTRSAVSQIVQALGPQASQFALDFNATNALYAHIFPFEAAHLYAEHVDLYGADMDADCAAAIDAGRDVTDAQYAAARAAQANLKSRAEQDWPPASVLILPTTGMTAPKMPMKPNHPRSPATFTRLFNLLDYPALSVPLPSDAGPAGLQLCARPADTALLFKAAALIKETCT